MTETFEQKVSAFTKAAMDKINQEIETKGFYITKSGKTITSLGTGLTPEAIAKGQAIRAENTKARHRPVASTIKTLRDKGYTLQAIADELNAAGVKTARGAIWTPAGVSRIIKSAE